MGLHGAVKCKNEFTSAIREPQTQHTMGTLGEGVLSMLCDVIAQQLRNIRSHLETLGLRRQFGVQVGIGRQTATRC
jgi:hypothetical protein